MLIFGSTAINVIEDLILARQGKSFAGWRKIYYDYAKLINLLYKQKRKFIKVNL